MNLSKICKRSVNSGCFATKNALQSGERVKFLQILHLLRIFVLIAKEAVCELAPKD